MDSSYAAQPRSVLRRSPNSYPHPYGHDRDGSQHSASGRSTSGSSGRLSGRNAAHDKQLSQIEKSVTHLLVATKELLETLTRWSRRQASETDVSDVYVRLGYEFNLACRAFQSIGVETMDLGPVPDMLRTILEDTLSQEAAPESLEQYLPRIRDIIINLLQGLKKRQVKLRPRQSREGRSINRNDSVGSTELVESSRAVDELPMPPHSPSSRRPMNYQSELPPVPKPSGSERQINGLPPRDISGPEPSRYMPAQGRQFPQSNTSTSNVSATDYFPHPPPPPPKQNDAIGMLQRSGELERRASRRFSTYQIQRHLGTSATGVPALPTQGIPAQSRGREVRESMNAVRLRGQMPTRRLPNSPVRNISTVQEESSAPQIAPVKPSAEASPVQKTPTDKIGSPIGDSALSDAAPSLLPPDAAEKKQEPARALSTFSDNTEFTPDQSPLPDKELTLFLQYKSKIKKYVIPEGSSELSIGRLQLAFIEKFAWNTHNNGVDLPEIYIQDPISGVRHELEDLGDVKDRSVLVLNVEALDEVKKHFDDSFGGLRDVLTSVRGLVEGQGSSLRHLSDSQKDAAKEIARIAATPVSVSAPSNERGIPGGNYTSELQDMRRDLAVLRQTYSAFTSDIAASMSSVRAKADNVKTAAVEKAAPNFEGDAGRAHINAEKKTLSDESEKLVRSVDDLQDLVEDLRKDVVTRGVRPLPRQLEAVGRDIGLVTKDLKKMQDLLKREKPVWTKVWEKELQMVCEERDQLSMQEDLAVDLADDLEKATQTFSLVEQATKQQNVQANSTTGSRNMSRNLPFVDPTVDLVKAKDTLLGEVRALQPNHQDRVEAIERAEKARQLELAERRVGVFQKELGSFVEEGKLKKSGGFEEVERQRDVKDSQARKEIWDMTLAQAAEKEKRRKEREATRAAQAQAQTGEQTDPSVEGGSVTEADGTPTAPPPQPSGEQPGIDDGLTEEASTASPVSPQKSWFKAIFASG